MINVKQNRKGHVFAIGLVILTLVVCGVVLYSFTQSSKPIEKSMVSPFALQEIYNKEAKFNFYTKESAKLASQQALFETARKGAVSGESCKPYELNPAYVVWDDNCNPILGAYGLFTDSFNSSFVKFLSNYPYDNLNSTKFSVSIGDKSADIKSEAIALKTSAEGILSYSAEYSFNASLIYDLGDMGPGEFKDIYRLAYKKLNDDCKKRSSDIGIITSCMNEIRPDRWNIVVLSGIAGGKYYMLFDMATKKKFYFDDNGAKWQQVSLKFAIAI